MQNITLKNVRHSSISRAILRGKCSTLIQKKIIQNTFLNLSIVCILLKLTVICHLPSEWMRMQEAVKTPNQP